MARTKQTSLKAARTVSGGDQAVSTGGKGVPKTPSQQRRVNHRGRSLFLLVSGVAATSAVVSQCLLHVLVTVLIDLLAVALRKIKKYQKRTGPVMSQLALTLLCKEIVQRVGGDTVRFSCNALVALQEACEHFLVQYFTGR